MLVLKDTLVLSTESIVVVKMDIYYLSHTPHPPRFCSPSMTRTCILHTILSAHALLQLGTSRTSFHAVAEGITLAGPHQFTFCRTPDALSALHRRQLRKSPRNGRIYSLSTPIFFEPIPIRCSSRIHSLCKVKMTMIAFLMTLLDVSYMSTEIISSPRLSPLDGPSTTMTCQGSFSPQTSLICLKSRTKMPFAIFILVQPLIIR